MIDAIPFLGLRVMRLGGSAAAVCAVSRVGPPLEGKMWPEAVVFPSASGWPCPDPPPPLQIVQC